MACGSALVGPQALAASPDIQPPPGGGGAPDCSGLIHPSAIQFHKGDVEVDPLGIYTSVSWRHIGLGSGLKKYLGAGGHGVVQIFVYDIGGTHDEGYFNASSDTGMNVPLSAGFGPLGKGPDIEIWAFLSKTSSSKSLCQSDTGIANPNNPGPA
jgi:hypothetical protein